MHFEDNGQNSKKNSAINWIERAKILHWEVFPQQADQSSFGNPAEIRWFADGKLNVCYNCVDRHLAQHANKAALIFETDEPGNTKIYTFQQVFDEVCRLANVLKSLGVQKGDVVTLYLPMIPELVFSMLACARLGAIHSVVFSGFSGEALAERLGASESKILLTVNQSQRGGRTHQLMDAVKQAVESEGNVVQTVLVMDKRVEEKTAALPPKTFSYSALKSLASTSCPCETMSALDPLFILYTSGSTGKPKGVVHSSGGYLVYAAATHQAIFEPTTSDVYFCTADIGWITGHTYGVYGPLANATTLVLFQGVPTYPDASRYWKIIDQHKVSLFYTAPTALRALRNADERFVKEASLDSLRLLASVGEPIDPPTWQWYFEHIGHQRCPIMDTWWQTESGGVLLCPPKIQHQKPGCTAQPLLGSQPAILKDGKEVTAPEVEGALCFKASWPGQAMAIWKDPEYFQKSYFDENPGFYTSGDGAKWDADGDLWILGRLDDVLNVSGHRLNATEIEKAVMSHPVVAEACVVGIPHAVKGQGIAIVAVLQQSVQMTSTDLALELRKVLRQRIGPIAAPDHVVLVPELPKTRSGKIIRRLVRKIAEGKDLAMENTSMCANQECLKRIQNEWRAQSNVEKKV